MVNEVKPVPPLVVGSTVPKESEFKYEAPAATYKAYGLVIVMFVPALGAPAMYKVDALV